MSLPSNKRIRSQKIETQKNFSKQQKCSDSPLAREPGVAATIGVLKTTSSTPLTRAAGGVLAFGGDGGGAAWPASASADWTAAGTEASAGSADSLPRSSGLPVCSGVEGPSWSRGARMNKKLISREVQRNSAASQETDESKAHHSPPPTPVDRWLRRERPLPDDRALQLRGGPRPHPPRRCLAGASYSRPALTRWRVPVV